MTCKTQYVDRNLQLDLLGQVIDIFQEDIEIWGSKYKREEILACFCGQLSHNNVKLTFASQCSTHIIKRKNDVGYIKEYEGNIVRGEHRAWLCDNSTLQYAIRDLGLRFEFLDNSGRRYLYIDKLLEYFGIVDFLKDNGIDLQKDRFYSKSLFDLDLEDMWMKFVLEKLGYAYRAAYDLGKSGLTLNQDLNEKIRQYINKSKDKHSRTSVPKETLLLAAANWEYKVLLPHLYFDNQDFFNRQLFRKYGKQRSNFIKQMNDSCDSKQITEEIRDAHGRFRISTEHIIDYNRVIKGGFDPHIVENICFYAEKYNSSLPKWSSLESGLNKTRKLINDQVMTKDEVISCYREILGKLSENGIKTDEQKEFIDEVNEIMAMI